MIFVMFVFLTAKGEVDNRSLTEVTSGGQSVKFWTTSRQRKKGLTTSGFIVIIPKRIHDKLWLVEYKVKHKNWDRDLYSFWYYAFLNTNHLISFFVLKLLEKFQNQLGFGFNIGSWSGPSIKILSWMLY